ncbi:uncharacterized protein EDB91DRAFT_1153768 [Suillus paluster]|uniref:uncharacterized protein n=1 Tax=Suillus paluster TaxID=48578 RepID=UPI001B87C45A|nr:uncharacterized protein EDB91DRAFT_1153768 [Suillus paluster]KAG1731633.1 hypothetical protein EDB91DRAFT_1153768 [Suillus paluster]
MYEPPYWGHSARMGIYFFVSGEYYQVVVRCILCKLARAQFAGFGTLIGRCFYDILCFGFRVLKSLPNNPHTRRSATSNYNWWIPAVFSGATYTMMPLFAFKSTLIHCITARCPG